MSALSSSSPAVRSFSLWQVTQYLVITACGSVGGPWAADASTEATKNKAHTEASRAFRIFAENNKSEAAIVSRLKAIMGKADSPPWSRRGAGPPYRSVRDEPDRIV